MRHYSLLLVLGLIFLLTSCKTEQTPLAVENPSIPVTVATPIIKDVNVYLESIGTLQSSVFVEIRPQISGTLTEILIEEGQWVQPSTPLFTLDSRSSLLKVQELEAQIAIDRADFGATQKKLTRFKPLVQKDLIAQTEWDALEVEAEKFQASIDLHEARLATAKLDLEHCTLKSPVKGRVGKLNVHLGLVVANGQETPLTTISTMDPLIVEFPVTEKEFFKISKEIHKIEVTPLCSLDLCKTATITFLDNSFDSDTGLLLIRGSVDNRDNSLRPGQSVRVRIPIATASNRQFISQKAVRYNQQGPYVYVVQPDMTVAIRQLILGDEQGDDQIVLEGLGASELIVIDGHLRLSPGRKVEIKS